MIGIVFLMQSASISLDTTRWLEPYAVEFECHLVGMDERPATRLVARAQIAEGAEGSQAVELVFSDASQFQPGVTLRMREVAWGSSQLSLSNDDFEMVLPWKLQALPGSASYPEVAMVFDRDSDVVSMAGPCKVEKIEGAA